MKNNKTVKTYRELSAEEQRKTFDNYQTLCEQHPELIPFASFEEYHNEQCILDMDFDANTLECLG